MQQLSTLICGLSLKPQGYVSGSPKQRILEKNSDPAPLSRRTRTKSFPSFSTYTNIERFERLLRRYSFPETTKKKSQNKSLPSRQASPSRSREGSTTPTMEPLEKELKKRQNGTTPESKWISLADIKILITEENVMEVLQEEAPWEEDIEVLKKFVLEDAPQLFALLVWLENLPLLELFCGNSFGDIMFPVKFVETEGKGKGYPLWTIQSIKNPNKVNYYGKATKKREAEAFCDLYQWQFFAPVFSEKVLVYSFAPACRLPFLREVPIGKEGLETNFSVVQRFVIHHSHLSFSNNDQIGETVDDEGNPHVAVKELKSAQGLTKKKYHDVATNELFILTRFREQSHPHLIKVIAYYTKGKSHFFVFPWAERGNLRDFWKSQAGLSLASENFSAHKWSIYLNWFFMQLLGLAGAIKSLHYPNGKSTESCRHGDLKPENILCFGKQELGPEDIPTNVKLVIADAGLARVHQNPTAFRAVMTTTSGGTVMYTPPEAELQSGTPRSRRYDIWSLGCIYLEFLIWILYGNDALGTFREMVGQDQPFYEKGPPVTLKSVIGDSIKYIKDDPRCSELTALGRLVNLIEKQFLVINMRRTDTISRDNTPSTNEEPLSNIDGPMVMVTSATIKIESNESTEPFHPDRATAKVMFEEIGKIIDGTKKGGPLKWINLDRREDVAKHKQTSILSSFPNRPRSGSLGVRTQNELTPGRIDKFLDNNWVYSTDDEISQCVVPESREQTIKYDTSPLCNRCRRLKIWSQDCKFYDTLADLYKKSKNCDLCQLLSQAMLKRAARRDETIEFVRAGSFLTVGSIRWAPILSLCTTSDSKLLGSNTIQLGFPSVLDPGSKTHIKILSAWIKRCDNTRHLPPDKCFIPTRLLAVGEENSSRVHLVCNLPEKSVHYVALSHPWGSSDHKQPAEVKFPATTKNSIEKIKDGVNDIDLPKTFRDAITITRRLKVKYLWIDSLCIVQKMSTDGDIESEKDWEIESKLMDQVYSSAYFTIAASCAEHRFNGFLKPRTPRQFVTMTADDDSQFYICDVIDNFDSDVEQGALNQRGWVLQERALSRRTIHFTEVQTYWECGEGVWCETFTKTNNRMASFLSDSNFPHAVQTYKEGMTLQLYQNLYERYSILGLSFQTDRPRAIAGLEKRLMQALKSSGGYGVFQSKDEKRDYFHRGLLWQRSGATSERIEFRPDDHVPSWSWMAFHGGIRYMNVPFMDIEKAKDIKSPFEGIEPGTPYTDVNVGVVAELEAPVRTLTTDTPAWLILDEPNREIAKPLKCIVIGRSVKKNSDGQRKHYSIILSFLGIEDGIEIYERVGVAYLVTNELVPEEKKKYVRIR